MTNLMALLKTASKKSGKKSKGQSLAEYALIVGLIAVACIGALGTLGTTITSTLGDLTSAIDGAF
jgi:Flp pilus assembly pilin Flp